MQSAATPISVCSETLFDAKHACSKRCRYQPMALGYAAFGVPSNSGFRLLPATTFLVFAATVATTGSNALRSYFDCGVAIVLFGMQWERASTDVKASHLGTSIRS
jgi:hypothetical protein